MSQYLLFHTMCTLGDTDVHTIKWKVNFSNLRDSCSVKLDWTQPTKTNIELNYISRQNSPVELFLSYSDNFSKISIRTMQRFKSNNQNVIIQETQSPIKLQHVAMIDCENLLFDTVIIQIDIKHKKDTNYSTLPNLNNLLAEPSYFDCTIESCDGVMFKIHKCVLATRSDVFKAHFVHSEESSIIQSSFSEDVLKQLLNFIYSGMEAVQMDSVADRLFVAADFYHLNDLKSYCEYFLYKQLTEENAIETLEFADLHSAVNLKNFAMEFILCHANVALNSHAWANLKSPEILKALCVNAISN